MTKKFLRLFITALLAGFITISCNEVFAPEVNFGDNTYVNDYKDLVEQIKSI